MSKVSHLLEKLYEMDKKLGGREHINQKKKNFDEFQGLKELVLNMFFDIRKKIEQRQVISGRTNETIRIEYEIKEKMTICNKDIQKMNEYLKKNRSKDENLFEKRQKIYDNLHKQFKTLNQLLYNNDETEGDEEQGGTLNSSRNVKLLGQSQGERKSKGVQRELTEEEKQGMREIQENDKKQNEILDVLNQGVLQLKVKAEKMGESIDHTINQCKMLDDEMSKTENTLVASNNQLKTIIAAYRSPSKCCLDVALLLILLGLSVTIYYQVK